MPPAENLVAKFKEKLANEWEYGSKKAKSFWLYSSQYNRYLVYYN